MSTSANTPNILTEVFTFLTRPQLDTIIFTCRHIRKIVESHLSSTPCRFLADVYLGLSSQKFFFVYLAASAQDSAEGWCKTRYSKYLTLDWKMREENPSNKEKYSAIIATENII
uniref:F-box domain-containing protein n=1 Tax=Ditylenchus dipsaci TaxID=166011 RepID=A0A915DSG1_9BILA